MRKTVMLVLAALLSGGAAVAQEPPPGGPLPGGPDSARLEQLRAEVERRFADRARLELGLDDAQMARLRATNEKFMTQRRDLMLRQRDLRMALHLQMRPGVAANSDSVARLNETLRQNRARLFALEDEQEREMAGYLSPIQIAQYRELRERLMQRVNELRRDRPGGAVRPGGPGVRRPQGQGPRPGGQQRPPR
jgi:hypothetical protein